MKRVIIAFIVLSILSAGCTTKRRLEARYLGKWTPTTPQAIDSKIGRHKWVYERHIITYTYRLIPEDSTIILNGYIEYYKSIEESKYKHETVLLKYENLSLSFLFVDENFRVTAVEVQAVPKGFGRRMIDKVPFAITLPFSGKYKSVVTSYSFSALGS